MTPPRSPCGRERPRTLRPASRGRTQMTRIAAIVAAFGLVAFGRASAAEEKSETKTEHQADAKGSTNKVEKSSSEPGGAKHDEKTTVKHKKHSDGKTETTKESK